MRKRRLSGGQDFRIICACFVVVASACVTGLAQDAIPVQERIDFKERQRAKIEAAKHHDHFTRVGGVRPPVRPPQIVRQNKRSAVENHANELHKKQADARDEIKKSSEEVHQVARLIHGMTIEDFKAMHRAEAEWRRELRQQLASGNPIHEDRTNDGLDDVKRTAREQARKVTDEIRSQSRRE
jgi:hypothetical protein